MIFNFYPLLTLETTTCLQLSSLSHQAWQHRMGQALHWSWYAISRDFSEGDDASDTAACGLCIASFQLDAICRQYSVKSQETGERFKEQ